MLGATAFVSGTISWLSSSTQLLNGVVQISERLGTLLSPSDTFTAEEKKHLFIIQSLLIGLVNPLKCCILQASDRVSCVNAPLLHVERIVRDCLFLVHPLLLGQRPHAAAEYAASKGEPGGGFAYAGSDNGGYGYGSSTRYGSAGSAGSSGGFTFAGGGGAANRGSEGYGGGAGGVESSRVPLPGHGGGGVSGLQKGSGCLGSGGLGNGGVGSGGLGSSLLSSATSFCTGDGDEGKTGVATSAGKLPRKLCSSMSFTRQQRALVTDVRSCLADRLDDCAKRLQIALLLLNTAMNTIQTINAMSQISGAHIVDLDSMGPTTTTSMHGNANATPFGLGMDSIFQGPSAGVGGGHRGVCLVTLLRAHRRLERLGQCQGDLMLIRGRLLLNLALVKQMDMNGRFIPPQNSAANMSTMNINPNAGSETDWHQIVGVTTEIRLRRRSQSDVPYIILCITEGRRRLAAAQCRALKDLRSKIEETSFLHTLLFSRTGVCLPLDRAMTFRVITQDPLGVRHNDGPNMGRVSECACLESASLTSRSAGGLEWTNVDDCSTETDSYEHIVIEEATPADPEKAVQQSCHTSHESTHAPSHSVASVVTSLQRPTWLALLGKSSHPTSAALPLPLNRTAPLSSPIIPPSESKPPAAESKPPATELGGVLATGPSTRDGEGAGRSLKVPGQTSSTALPPRVHEPCLAPLYLQSLSSDTNNTTLEFIYLARLLLCAAEKNISDDWLKEACHENLEALLA